MVQILRRRIWAGETDLSIINTEILIVLRYGVGQNSHRRKDRGLREDGLQ